MFERLTDNECAFETKISDGYRVARGRGPTPEASQVKAQRKWLAGTEQDADAQEAVMPE